MSFNQLPDELISQTAGFLGFADNCRLRQTQKRIDPILKRYHHVGRAVYKMSFIDQTLSVRGKGREFIRTSTMSVGVMNSPKQLKEKVVQVKMLHSRLEEHDMTFEHLAEPKYIHTLKLEMLVVDEEFLRRLIRLKIEISYLEFMSMNFLNEDQLLQFYQCFKRISLDTQFLGLEHVRDEVLSKIIHKTELLCDDPIISNYATLNNNTIISDRILDQLRPSTLPKQLRFDDFKTRFTIEGITRLIELAMDSNFQNFGWHFGVLENSQNQAALRLKWDIISGRRMGYLWFCTTIGDSGPKYIITKKGHPRRSPFTVVFEIRARA